MPRGSEMKLRDFIILLLKEGTFLEDEVKIDASIPIPFEEKYEIKREKGWVLFKAKSD